MNNNGNIYRILRTAMEENAVINEIFTVATQVPGEPDLTNLRVISVFGDHAVFSQEGSGGLTNITVFYDKIVAIDM